MLTLDPDFFEAYLNFSAVPWRHGVLEPKVREFIYIAIDASTTHLHAAGTRTHMRNALRLGATREEIMEVLQLISVLGIHSVTDGVPLLVEEMAAAGRSAELPQPGAGGEREARLKAEFTAARGYWSELWDHVLALSPDFFEAYMHFSSVPWKHGMLRAEGEGVHLHRVSTPRRRISMRPAPECTSATPSARRDARRRSWRCWSSPACSASTAPRMACRSCSKNWKRPARADDEA